MVSARRSAHYTASAALFISSSPCSNLTQRWYRQGFPKGSAAPVKPGDLSWRTGVGSVTPVALQLLFSREADLQPASALGLEGGGHPQLASGHGSRPSPFGCDCQCISGNASGRWGCSGLSFCLSSLLPPPHLPTPQSILPSYPLAWCTTHIPTPASSLFPLTLTFLLHLRETGLWLSAP